MTTSDWTANRDYVAPSLANRAAGGGVIWLVGRVVLGGLFMMSGIQKLSGIDQFAASLANNGIPVEIAPLLAWLGAAVETIGGLCIVLGLATGWASLVLIAFTIVAAFIAHRFWQAPPEARMMQTAHFEKNMMIVGAFCLLYVAGGGPYSIDRWRRLR
ncbi:MAG TPA: DoxX family protein [Xanthobacteraceae bacterium]|nr:DoxX family protein [Xanthobacteraceae bacterium]